MAGKRRAPAPPRAVQAPRRRSEPRAPGRGRLYLAVGLGALLLAGGAGAAAFFAFGGDDEATGIAASGTCELRTLPSQGQGHVDALPKDFKANSYPRVTGPHAPQTAIFGEYDEPVSELNLVHNLEHGAVLVRWGPDVSEETESALRAWYRNDARGLILSPLPENNPKTAEVRDKITLSAWVATLEDEDDPSSEIAKQEGKLAVCDSFDEDAFDDFVSRYRAKGPERFLLEDLQPGSG